jgi:hypothetical protein
VLSVGRGYPALGCISKENAVFAITVTMQILKDVNRLKLGYFIDISLSLLTY